MRHSVVLFSVIIVNCIADDTYNHDFVRSLNVFGSNFCLGIDRQQLDWHVTVSKVGYKAERAKLPLDSY